MPGWSVGYPEDRAVWQRVYRARPSDQITMGEEILAQERHEIGQASAKMGRPLQVAQQKHQKYEIIGHVAQEPVGFTDPREMTRKVTKKYR
jgi:hypothetical protein